MGRLNPEEMVFEVLFLFFTATLLTPSLPNLGSPKTWGGRKGALLALADNQIGNGKVKRSYHRGQLLSSQPVRSAIQLSSSTNECTNLQPERSPRKFITRPGSIYGSLVHSFLKQRCSPLFDVLGIISATLHDSLEIFIFNSEGLSRVGLLQKKSGSPTPVH